MNFSNALYFLIGMTVSQSGLRFTQVFRATTFAIVPFVILCCFPANLDRGTLAGVAITWLSISLLLALAQNARRVLSREQLLELTRSDSVEVFDRTIDVLIMRLRRKIENNPHQPMLIKTLRGLGYVFAADVQHHDKAA